MLMPPATTSGTELPRATGDCLPGIEFVPVPCIVAVSKDGRWILGGQVNASGVLDVESTEPCDDKNIYI